MHIVDGVLSVPVLMTGAVVSVVGMGIGLKKLPMEKLPQTAMLSAVFFIASLIHIPFGVTSVHFIGNGLMGLALGWGVFPAFFIALVLQAIFFGFGGLLVLGVNTLNIALPALVVYYLMSHFLVAQQSRSAFVVGALSGALGILLSALMVALSLALSGDAFIEGAKLAVLSHLPLMVIEGALTGAAVYLLIKVKPDFFNIQASNGRSTEYRTLEANT